MVSRSSNSRTGRGASRRGEEGGELAGQRRRPAPPGRTARSAARPRPRSPRARRRSRRCGQGRPGRAGRSPPAWPAPPKGRCAPRRCVRDPTSTPRRDAEPHISRAAPWPRPRSTTAPQARRRSPPGRSAALRDVVLAATATPERLGGDADQSPGLEPPLAPRLVDRGNDHGPVGGDTGDHDDRRSVGREPAAHVKRELTQVVGAGAVRRAVRHDGDSAEVTGLRGQLARHLEHLRGAEPLQLLLGGRAAG